MPGKMTTVERPACPGGDVLLLPLQCSHSLDDEHLHAWRISEGVREQGISLLDDPDQIGMHASQAGLVAC